MSETTNTGATFSDCRAYRYALLRQWDASLPLLVVIGLNPSTADETVDDPTIRRCVDYATRWGMGGLRMLNLFAYRATEPRDMKRAFDPVGRQNDTFLRALTFDVPRVLCAWGAHGSYMDRDRAVLSLLRDRPLYALKVTKGGHPGHPLYLRADLTPEPFGVPAHV
jgi:hypothetical protein